MAAVRTVPIHQGGKLEALKPLARPLPNAVGTAVAVGGSLIAAGFALATVLSPLLRGKNGRQRK